MAFKIGVISDTHLNKVTFELEELFQKYFYDVDILVHAGDSVSLAVLDYLSQKPLKAVSGNMDPFEIQSSLPHKLTFEVAGKRFGLIHGWGAPWDLSQRVLKEFSGVEIIIFGHSHLPYCSVEKGVLLFNPGSPELTFKSRNRSKGTLGIIEIGETIDPRIIEL